MTVFRGNARYELVRELGVGGMGRVYEAIDHERGDRRVALKVLQGQDADSIARIKREFRTLHDVRHPNLVALYELAAEGDTWFFTLELIEGVDFLSWIRPGGARASEAPTAGLDRTVRSPSSNGVPLDLARVNDGFRQLAEGVSSLHARGRVHRDLKPSNVMVTKEGRVVILDFGLVAELGGPGSLTEEEGRAIVGTVAYMAPEQAGSGPVGPAADWYAVGVMLFQSLTGRLPFEGPPVDVMFDKQRRPAPSPNELNSNVPADLGTFCSRLLKTVQTERPTPAEVLAVFGAAVPKAATPPTARLLGREKSLEVLHRAFERTKTKGPQVVRVIGSPGMGRTALLRAFRNEASERGAVVLAGRCHERETVPFKAVDPLVDSLTRYLGTLPLDRVEALRPRDASLLAEMFPVLRRLPAFKDAPGRAVEEPQERRRRAVLALRELFERLGERVPLVVLVDDAQWGDADSVVLMEAVLRPPEPPTVLVVTSIRDDGPALPQGTVPVEELRLPPLETSACVELAGRAGVSEERATALARESAGNPLLLMQLLESSGDDVVTLEALWQQKFERLGTPARRLLETVCVALSPIDAVAAQTIADVSQSQADLVPQLASAHLLRLLPDERRVEPWHDGLRRVVTRGLDAARTSELHLRIATVMSSNESIDPETVAAHFTAAGASDQAAEATLLAANRARMQFAFGRAATLFRRTLELLPSNDRRRFELMVELGKCLADAGQGKDAATTFIAATKEPGAVPEIAEELRRLSAEQLLLSGHVDEGVGAISEVLRDLGMTLAPTPGRALGALLFRRAHLALRGRAFDERAASEVAPALLRRIDACWSVAVGLGMVETIRGASFQTRQLLLALEAGEPSRVARALAAEGAFLATNGASSERKAAGLLLEARALCERVGDARLRGLVTFCEGLSRFLVGDFKEARSRVADAEAAFRDAGLGVSWEAASARLFSIWSLFYLGELAELSRRTPVLVREAQSRGDRYAVTSLTVGLSNVALLAADRPAEARAAVTAAMAAWPSKGFHFQHYWAALSDGLISLYEGTPAPALEHVLSIWPKLERSMLLRIQNVRVEAWSLRGRLAVAAGREDLAKQALAALRKERVPWAAAQALVLDGLCDRPRLATRLSEAIAQFDHAGMRLFAAAARLRLGALQPADLGDANRRAARAWFETQDVKNPDAFARTLIPEA